MPGEISGGKHVWNQYTIRVVDDGTETRSKRDRLREKLQADGVISMVYYPIPLHLQPIYLPLGYQVGSLPHTEQVAKEVLSLPLFPDMTVAEQIQVVYALKEHF